MTFGDIESARLADLSDRRRSPLRRIRRYVRTVSRLDSSFLLALAAERFDNRLARWKLEQLRGTQAAIDLWRDEEPLVTLRITTFERTETLLDRALASALAQTYKNLEILVLGDGEGDQTRDELSRIKDPRIRYVNLPFRPNYPRRARDSHFVSGYAAANLGLDLARGQWIVPCDDDDELSPGHVESLLHEALSARSEFVWARTEVKLSNGKTLLVGDDRLRQGHITHCSVLYASYLRIFRYSAESWRVLEPLDWNLWKRMAQAGVTMTHLPQATSRYYPSPATRQAYDEIADDLLKGL